jgi:hypothetical protein
MTWLSVPEMIERIVRACAGARVVCVTPNTPKALIHRLAVHFTVHEDLTIQGDLLIATASEVSEQGDVHVADERGLPLLPIRAIAWIVPAPSMLFAQRVDRRSIQVHQVIFEGGLLDVTPNGLLLREVPTGISARQVQARCHATLWADRELQVIAR